MPPTILDMVKLVGMMTLIAALYSALGTTPELRWCWIAVSVLLLCWSLLSLAVVVNTRKNATGTADCSTSIASCFSKWLGLYHMLFVCLHLAATMLLVSTGGLTTHTVDFTLVYPIAAMALPVCVSLLVDSYIRYKMPVHKLPMTERLRLNSVWIATRFWIPGRAKQWGSTKG